jgi:Na+-translocating ferredoxin:NAD+ oxidoreductase RNF subunit RnfB
MNLDRRGFLTGGFLALFHEPSPPQVRYGTAPATQAAGVAHIVMRDCLAWQGTTCSTCRERCPVIGAIRLDRGRPSVEAAVCTGCGDCVAACPAPRPAIRTIPKPPGAAP